MRPTEIVYAHSTFRRFTRAFALSALAALVCIGPVGAQDDNPEEDLHIHRLKNEATSPYDAFVYSNRVQAAPAEGESPVDYAGIVILSRLANMEGRIQLKVVDGFDRSEYVGYKAFLRAWPEEGQAVGNCVACHTPPKFAGSAKYVVDDSGEAKAATPLRNLKKSDAELEAIVRQKVKMAEMARAGSGNIDEAYKLIDLDDQGVTDMVNFLQSLNEVPKDDFRDLITNATILDTSDMLN